MPEIQHLIVYEGLLNVSLGAMIPEYVPLFVPAINRRVGVEGTMQRGPYTPGMGLAWLKRLEESRGKEEVFAILLHVDGENGREYRYIGHTGIHGINWPWQSATTGSMIVDVDSQGKGYGTEAKLLLLHHAFHVLGLRKLTSTVKAFNGGSMGHLLKTGYRIAGRYKENVPHEGGYVDEVLFEVFREDFEPTWEQYQASKELLSLTGEQRALIRKEIDKE